MRNRNRRCALLQGRLSRLRGKVHPAGSAALGAIATTPEIEGWYGTLQMPSWNTPAWIFGPVWTTLYILMAIAAWLVWRPAGFAAASTPLTLFTALLSFTS